MVSDRVTAVPIQPRHAALKSSPAAGAFQASLMSAVRHAAIRLNRYRGGQAAGRHSGPGKSRVSHSRPEPPRHASA